MGFLVARVRFQQSWVRTGDTIIACATAPGFSARAIVRVSGPGAFGVVEALETTGTQGTNLADARLVARDPGRARGIASSRIALDGGGSLPCLIASFPGPASYTGEDVVEFFVPGNPHLIERVMRIAMQRMADVRLAGPGEFTARAFLNERMTLEQAEGVGALIAAESAEELEEAKRLLSGERGGHYRAFSDEAMTLLALVEAGIDFTDQEDVVAIEPAELTRRASALAGSIEALLRAQGGNEERKVVTRVVLAGAPNAGKSTLFNALLGRRRAVVSPIAGTTRDVLEEPLDLSRDAPGAGWVLLCDTAGLAPGAGEIAAAMAGASTRAIDEAGVVVWCDPAGRFEAGTIAPAGGAVIRVRTKADLPHGRTGEDAIEVSALDGYQLPTLRRAMADAAWGRSGTGGLLPRHRRGLEEAATALRELHGDESRRAPEIAAGRLRRALDSLGELTGRMSPDDVIGRVFATFCVGK